ncbi:MAG: 1-deoxy-D-xylulose-5-phosphate reductoisomerase [Clostridia bacterium]|nr:1-deoxy-D-xylulose-5-phosphate reductoisomerase [Clostridia bacterium]
MKKIVILGSTGSIGRQALEVVDAFPEMFEIIGLAAGSNVQLLAEQVQKYQPRYVSIGSKEDALALKSLINSKTEIFYGEQGLINLAGIEELDLILVSVSGIHGLLPTLKALENQTTVALANKETIVTAGSLVMEKAKKFGTAIIPVDSEHSAIFQCLEKENLAAVEQLILTASGGPFFKATREELAQVTPQMALSHPNWKMGAKITIDSAGLINKGLEIIEAHWLFNVPYEKIKVVIHPQSVIHSMVQYKDGSVLAQLGCPDMKIPIQYAFTYPQRLTNFFPRLDFYQLEEITFSKPDFTKFPGLALAIEAGKIGGTMTTVFNGANEEAVLFFLNGRIRFIDIPQIIEKVMIQHQVLADYQVSDILEIDRWARQKAQELMANL